jgi:hypothetical protein
LLIAQLAIDQKIIYMIPHLPFVMKVNVSNYSIASYWKTWTGIDESKSGAVNITSFVRDSLYRYSKVESVNDCFTDEQTFYFDIATQILYVHFEHLFHIYGNNYSYGLFFGYSNKTVFYLDNIEYLPLIQNSPKVSSSQDFNGYDKLTFQNSSLELLNLDGILDQLLTLDIYGNTVNILFVDEYLLTIGNIYGGPVLPLASFFIEDYTISNQQIQLSLQDLRKSLTTKIPRNLFNDTQYPNIEDGNNGKSIPFLYGQVREIPAYVTNGKVTSGNVTYRAAEFLTQLSLDGNVFVKNGDIWAAVTPISIDLSTGSFTLSAASARNGETPLKCKIVGPIGFVINYTSDIIKDINSRFLGIPFTSSNYNLDEWTNEESQLTSGGILFEKLTDSYEAFRIVQNESVKGFRYEFNSSGKRTIRIDDFNRIVSRNISNVDILNIDDIEVENDPQYVFAEIQIGYSKSYFDNEYQQYLDNSRLDSVRTKFKQQIRYTPNTILVNKTNAILRANNDVDKYSEIRPINKFQLFGREYFDIRIYDIVNIEITRGFVDLERNIIKGRQFYGIKKCQVIKIDPRDESGINYIGAVIIGDYDFDVLLITQEADYIQTNDGYEIAFN